MDVISSALRDTLRALASAPVAFEALWDGDSDGWHLTLFAVLSDGAGGHRSVFLSGFEEPAGDLRLFNAAVPPWPESHKATLVGEALSLEFGLPFHFPAASWPEDDCPHWWELASSYPCGVCEIALLQREPCPWRGVCYRCHLAAEHAAKEARLTPEERAGPRCHVCSRPAKDSVRELPRCEACLRDYEDYSCSTCQAWTMIARTRAHTERCSRCEMVVTLRRLTAHERQTIVDADGRGTMSGIVVARQLLRCDLSDARLAIQLLGDESLWLNADT